MVTVDSLYQLFGASPTCSDDELRHAYYRALLKHHPDKDPEQIEAATATTQQLTVAYAELKKYRTAPSSAREEHTDLEYGFGVTVEGIEFTIRFSFGEVDIKEIAKRKGAFRDEWENLRRNPADPICALRLIHAAFGAEQQDAVSGLLINSILIDAASLLLSFVKSDEACETLIRWADFLQQNRKIKESIQILEDAYATGKSSLSVAEELRRSHYARAQYDDPTTGSKPTPDLRIAHLHRILELGFKYDYIYKLLAEAYHDFGDDERARTCLSDAYRVNPELTGAVRISRALGFPERQKASRSKAKATTRYKYSRPEQVPAPIQVREWAEAGGWDAILGFANPDDYSRRILSKSRETLRQVATSLGEYNNHRAIEALTNLLNFTYYWDVSEATVTSLSRIGDDNTLSLLRKFRPGNSRGQAHLDACISYLQARVSNQLPIPSNVSAEELWIQAEKAFAQGNYGRARLLLENLLAGIVQGHPLRADAILLLARCCAEMNDLRTSIELIKPVFAKLPEESRRRIAGDFASWLWEDLVFKEYHPSNDEDYLLALNIHLDLALASTTPDEVLGNLRYLARWLELLGVGDTVQWIRTLIRREAPGTWYVDKHDRKQYVRNVELSNQMKGYLAALSRRVRVAAPSKLQQVLRSQAHLKNAEYLLDD